MSFRIDLQPSRLLLRLQAAQIGLALAACLLVLQNSLLLLLLFVPLSLAGRQWLQGQRGPRALVLMENEWYLVYEQDVYQAQLQQRVYCTEHLQILLFSLWDEGKREMRSEQVLILPDSAATGARRQLRTLLRWYPFPASAVAA